MLDNIPYQETLALSSFFSLIASFFAIFILNEILKDKDEFRYLIGFYISATVFFFYINYGVVIVDSPDIQIADILGGFFSLFLALTICKKNKSTFLFKLSLVLYLIHLIVIVLMKNFVFFPLITATAYGVISLIAIIMNKYRNKADIGLLITIAISVTFSFYELFTVQVTISRGEYFQTYFYYPLIIFPAYILSITTFIFSSYLLENQLEYKKLAHIDPLTNLNNRRSAFQLIENHIALGQRKEYECFLIMADIDHFKSLNDNFGHIEGDNAIAFVANLIRNTVRNYDICCRFGGEEFLVFLPNINEEKALSIAERIRREIEKESNSKKFGPITISIGLSSYTYVQTLNDNIELSDKALYQAKCEGRNKVCIYKLY